MRRRLTTLFVLLLCSFSGIYAQQVVNNLFQPLTTLKKSYHSIASKYQSLEINTQTLTTLKAQAPSTLELQLPFENGQLTLELEKVSITSPNFSVIEALPNNETRTVSYSGSVFYQGKIKGQPNSSAAISLVGDQVMGIASDAQSNIILGAIEEQVGVASRATKEYTLYRDADLQVNNPTNCFTADDNVTTPVTPGTSHSSPTSRETFVGSAIDIYFEADLAFYQNRSSSTTNVINFILGFFNNTALLYANNDVKIQVSQIKVWTTTDPEANQTSTSGALSAFGGRMAITDYIGDFAHFLTTRNLGGGIAYVNSGCPPKSNRAAVSAINPSYSSFPTYSWTVQVVTHELGHNLGSRHTHWCGWPGGPIDGCGPTASAQYQEGNCAIGPLPANQGTIMSYCHLLGVGISFNNGFGPLPGQAIRNFVAGLDNCNPCNMTIDIAKQDASCGQNNGEATITVANAPSGTVTYLWSNGATTSTVANLAPGTYYVTVKSGNCQVMEDVVITPGGTNLSFTLTPSGTAGYCAGGSLTLQATTNASYTYEWRVNNNPIPGATSSSLTVNTPGDYEVRATSGSCSGVRTVAVSVIAPPAASITPGGPTTFCSGNNVVLNANIGAAYQYQWFNGANPIADATSGTYTATTSGNYSVRIRAGSTCEATSTPVSVTVNPSPTVNVATSGPLQFCNGSGVVMVTTNEPGYTFQWYNGANPITDATADTYTARIAGTFTVRTTLGPCTVTSSPDIVTSVLPAPTIAVTPVTSTIRKFETVTLTATPATGINFNWSSLPDLVSSTNTTGTYAPLTTTTYELIGTNSNGCKDTAYAAVNVIGCGDIINPGSVILSPSRIRLEWTNPEGAASDSVRYRIQGTTTWTYVYVAESNNLERELEINNLQPNTVYEYEIIPLCTTTTVFVPTATQTVRTAELENGLYIQLTPNPTGMSANTVLEIITASEVKLSIDIFDLNGKLVQKTISSQTKPAGQLKKTLDISRLSGGLYIISVNVNDKRYPVRMVIHH